jgi:acetyl esterase/lipase
MSLVLKMIIGQMKRRPALQLGPDTDYAARRAFVDAPANQMPPQKSVRFEKAELGSVPAECCVPQKLETENVILYIHGGAFAFGNTDTSRAYASVLAEMCGAKVYTLGYRLAPENKYPAAVDDCFAAYQALVRSDPEKKFVIVGESAGATLTLTTALRAKAEGLTMPSALVPISPAATMAEDPPSRSRNGKRDLVVPYENVSELLRQVYLEEGEDPKNPLVSPLYGDYAGFPPVFITTDESEVLHDDAVLLSESMKKAGVSVSFCELAGTFHSFPTLGNICPESKAINEQIRSFVRSALA